MATPDFNFPAKGRPLVAFEGTPIGARFVPHRGDLTKLVLKSPHPEGAAMLAQLAGVDPGETTRGRNFYQVTVDKAAFLAGLGGVIAKALLQNEPTNEAPVAPEVGPEDEEEEGEELN